MKYLVRLILYLALVALPGLLPAQTTWTQSVLPGPPFPSDLLLTSASGGQSQFEATLGAGGSLTRMIALRDGNKDMLPYGTTLTGFNTQWSVQGPAAFDDGDPATDDRFLLYQSGTSGQRLAPMMLVEKNPASQAVDVYSVARDQWNSNEQPEVEAAFSSLVRYEPQADGSIKVRRVIRFGEVVVSGLPWTLSAPLFEHQNSFPVTNFNRLATGLGGAGNILTSYVQDSNIPQDQQTDVSLTNGYAVAYNSAGISGSAAIGIVFGKQQMASPNHCVVNYSDDTTAISVRPGVQLVNVTPGSILDATYYLVPAYGVNAALASRLATLAAATPAPVLYPPTTGFTGELAAIVQRLNDNLTVNGVRTDRLGHDVTPLPVTTRPMLLSGPENDADIRARLAVFPQVPESLLRNYLYGTDTQKQAANDYFFRYPGNGDGNGLRSEYISQMSRALMWDLYRYDIALGLGKATQAQKDLMLSLAEAKINAVFPYFNLSRGGGNLALEDDIALGLAALNFPDHPDAQLWLSRSITYTKQILDGYFPDGSGNESPRYQDWVLDLMSKYLQVFKRRLDLDLYDEPWLRSSLDWFIRFSSPPLDVVQGKSVTPAWGDSTYSSIGSATSKNHYYYDLSLFAEAYKDRDPAFSARLMHWWEKNGRPLQVYNAGSGSLTNSFLIDPRLPSHAQRPNTSTYSPWRGSAALHGGNGVDGEFMATFQCGKNGGVHSDADMGTFDLFAFGAPLVLDSTSGPYISGTTFNENTFAHNTVSFNGVSGGDTASGQFLGFGTSDVADYVSAKTPYGTVSNRHMVMVKPDYLVIWDETTASSYADWYLHTPAQSLEWQDHKVVSHTPWNVDLEVNFLLPSAPLVAPTFPGSILNTSDPTATVNPLASAASDPGTAGMFTTQGQSRCSANDVSRNPFPFSWQTYFSVRNSSASGDFLTVLQPRKVGETPALTTQLLSSSSSGVTLQVNFNGRVDTIEITTTGATVTKGGQPAVQFAKSWPQSGVSGAAAYVKADFSTNPVTTLTNALTTTGPVEVHTGTLALGADERVPNTSPLHIMPGGTFDLVSFTETTGTFIVDGGSLTGSGTLKPSNIEWWGGTIEASVAATGNFVKKNGADWSRPAGISYAGDTVIEAGKLAFQPGGPALPGTGRVVLADGTGIQLNGASTSIRSLDVTGTVSISTGTLAVSGFITGTGSLDNAGNLDLSGVGSVASTITLSTSGMVVLPAGGLSVKRLIINGLIQPAGIAVNAAMFPGFISGTGTITPLEDISVPANLSAAVSLGRITLSWTAVEGATAYSVRRSLVAGGPYTEIGAPTSNSFVDTDVIDGVTYFYVVATHAALGDSMPSSEVSATASGPWYFDPNGTAAGSVSNGGSYTWVSNSWTITPGGTAAVSAWAALRDAQFAATNPGSPLAYSVSLAGFSGAAHGFKSLRVATGTVTFTGMPGNFYFTQPPVITADAGAVIRFAQTGSLAFNLNKLAVTFDGAGTTQVSNDTAIMNTGSIVKKGTGTLVLAAPNIYNGSTSIEGGVLRLAVTDLPTLWLDATNSRTLTTSSGALAQWNDSNGRGTFVYQGTAASRPTPVTDASLPGVAKELVDFGSFSATSAPWMPFNADMTDIRALFWVGKTTNDNFLLGSNTVHDFHSGGPASTIWSSNTSYSAANIRNGVTWLYGTPVNGTTTNMPPVTGLVRLGVFTSGNVSANALARDRTYRYGGEKIGEALVFNTALSAQQQSDIDAYLAKKWFDTGIGIGNRLPVSTVVSLANGGVLDLTGINFQTVAGLTSSDHSGTRVDLGAADLTIDGAASSSFDGSITGTGGFHKKGSDVLALEGGNTYTGPTVVDAGTLVIDGSITSDVTVKDGAVLVNNGIITGNVVAEGTAIYQGEGTVTGAVSLAPPVVTITSPAADNSVMTDLAADLGLTASVAFNTAVATPSVAWSMVSGPGTVTFGDASSIGTTARFSVAGTYALRCTASVTVEGQLLEGSAERIVRPGGPLTSDITATFRQGENGYSHIATFIRGDTATWNSGARDQLLIGRFNNQPMRGLFSFDLTGIPAEATITSAAFDLWIAATNTGSVNTLELRPLLKDIVEGTGNSSSSATVGAGTGADWNSRTGPTTANLWGTPGGQVGTDFSTTVIGSLNGFDTGTTAVGTQCAFTLAPAFVAETNADISGARPLRFMLTVAGDTSGSNYFARFASDDHATTSQRPRLTLNYSVPVTALPVVDCGPAPAATSGQPANLAGSGTGSLFWSQDSGPDSASFAVSADPATSVTFPAPGNYVLRLTATSAAGSSSRSLAISVAPADPFASWQVLHWPGVNDPAVIGASADPDHDGESNLLEFATGQEPAAGTRALINVANLPSGFEFTYTRSKASFDAGCQFSVEYTDTLDGFWASAGEGTVISDGSQQTVRVVIPESPAGTRFARLRITAP